MVKTPAYLKRMIHVKMEVTALTDLAEQCARAAGDHALKHYDRRQEVDKSLPYDIKLVLDRECQTVAEATVLHAAPDHGILGEEGVLGDQDADIVWIIDPIDGTLNFTHGLPHWGVSVAARHREHGVLAGCVYLPMYEECFTASVQQQALCNGTPVRVAPDGPMKEAMVLSGVRVPHDDTPIDLSKFSTIMQHAQKTRLLSAAAVDLCWVACGKADAYIDDGLFVWDLAAGNLLVEQAGGTTRTRPYKEEGRFDLIAGQKQIVEEAVELLQF